MRCLTLTQPFATLVAIGAKKIETRSWATSYRGKLAIHAAAGYGKGGMRGHKALCGTEPFCSVLNEACARHYAQYRWLKELVEHPFMPLGAIVAVCELKHCIRIDEGLLSYQNPGVGWWIITEQERAFDDYTPGRFAWLLANGGNFAFSWDEGSKVQEPWHWRYTV